MKKIKLYDYQQKMLNDVVETLAKPVRGVFYDRRGRKMVERPSVMVQMPTGTGKTYVMASIVKWFLDTHEQGEVWIVAHRRELVEQMQETLDRFCLNYGRKLEVLQAKVRVRVLSVQWITRHVRALDSIDVGLVVIDEAHHAVANSYQDFLDSHPTTFIVGMTATPCRMKRQAFSHVFTYLLTSPCTRDFIDKGYLAPYEYVVIGKYSNDQLLIDSLKKRGADGDYDVKEMDEKLNVPDSVKRLYASVREYGKERKGIVFAIDILHAKMIAQYYREMGLKAMALDSTTPEKQRREMVEAFRKGELECLVNVNLFDEGFDCPDVEYIQMARPTLSLTKYLQMVGRGLRINHENRNKVCIIIDNVGNYRKFGLPDKERNWPSMFAGLREGKGILPPSLKPGVQVVGDDTMVCVRRADIYRKMTAAQRKKLLKEVKPFKAYQGAWLRPLWGLRISLEDVILQPVYWYISDFVGDYAAFMFRDQWGILGRDGKVVVAAEYHALSLLPRGRVKITYPYGREEIVSVKKILKVKG